MTSFSSSIVRKRNSSAWSRAATVSWDICRVLIRRSVSLLNTSVWMRYEASRCSECLLEPSERLEQFGEQVVGDELHVGLGLLRGEIDRPTEHDDCFVDQSLGDVHTSPSDLDGHERR